MTKHKPQSQVTALLGVMLFCLILVPLAGVNLCTL